MMQATKGTVADIARLQGAEWLFDLKLDGIRAVATVRRGQVTLQSRNETITSRYPEVVDALQQQFAGGDVVLDGEIVVIGEDGYPSWEKTIKRNAQQRNAKAWSRWLPAQYQAFDLLELDGVDRRDERYGTRRLALIGALGLDHPVLRVTPASEDGEAMWRLVEEHHLEGVIAKRLASKYRDGRSKDWVKIKRTSSVTCLVGGTDPGEGSRASTFGALHLYLLDEWQEPVLVGKVGSGFTDAECKKVMQRLHHPETPLVVEVEYLEYVPGGLRNPVFQRVRDDVAITDCTLDQLA